MYRNYFGLSSLPFKTTPDLDFFYKNGSRQEILEALIYTLSRGDGIIKVTGEVGCGKTMLLRLLAHSLPAQFKIIYINSPNLSAKDMLLYICNELQLDVSESMQKFTILNMLKQYLLTLHSQHRNVIMLIDEAQSMTLDGLEEIRLLSNLETSEDKLIQIVLFGQPELDVALDNAKIRQLKSRISYSIYVPTLTPEEVQAYLNYRMRKSTYEGLDVFDAKISKIIHKLSNGLPRAINVIADKLLMIAYGDDSSKIKRKHIKLLPESAELAQTNSKGSRIKEFFLVLVFLLLLVIGFLSYQIYDLLNNTTLFKDSSLVQLQGHIKEGAVLQSIPASKQSNGTFSEAEIPTRRLDGGLPLNTAAKLHDDTNNNVAIDVFHIVDNATFNEPSLIIGSENTTPLPIVLKSSQANAKAESPKPDVIDNVNGIATIGMFSASKNGHQLLGISSKDAHALIKHHAETSTWLTGLPEDSYVIQLSTRTIDSLYSNIAFYEQEEMPIDSVHLLIDFNTKVQKYRIKVLYVGSNSYSTLFNKISELPVRIQKSKPYVTNVKQLHESLVLTNTKLIESGIINVSQ